MPTEKQISYALSLLGKAGYSTRFMNADYKALGASMSDRSGTVAAWLKKLGKGGVSQLIDRLK